MSSPRALRRLRLLAVAQVVLLLASLGAPLTTIAADGDGTVTVTPTSATAGSTGNVLTFVHTVGANWAGGNSVRLQITVPGGGWSAPTTGAGAGQVAISAETCAGSLTLSTSGSDIRVSGNNSNCVSGNTITITYNATAGTTTGANTFSSSTRTAGAGGSLQPIATSPVVTVNPVVKVDTTTVITSDTPDPSIVGSAFAVGVSVTRASGSSTITGTVTVSDGTDSCTDTTPSGGAAATVTYSCSITSTTTGLKTLTATYAGDASFNGSSGTASHTVNGADGTGTVAVHWDPVGGFSYADPPITPGMSLELVDFNFTATANMPAGSQVTIVVPAGWTAPTIANSPGVVAINPTTPGLTTPTCTLPTAGTPQTSISGSGPWTITIDVTCAAGATFRLRWGNTLANVITAASAGTYEFTTQSKVAGGTLTNIASQPTLTVNKLNQAALVLTGTSSPAAYGSTQTLGTTGGSGTGAVTYTSTTPTVCTVSGTTLSIVSGTGTCSVYATKAADANYNAQTSATVNLTAAKINQAALVLTGTSSPAAYGSTQTLGTTGGSGTGAVTYSTGASTACSVSGNTLTITSSTGTCSVTATKATDANYNAQTSAAVAITVGKAVLTVTPDAKAMTFGDPVPAYTFGVTGFAFGQNAGTAAGYVAPTCTSTYTAATPVASSPLTITCSGGSATHYTFDTTATALLSIGKANQAALVLTGTSSPAAYGSTQTLGTTGGSGTGAVTYTSTTPTVCTVSGTTLSIVSGTGTCSVYATKAADANYNAQTSATVNLTAAKINQAALVLTGTSSPAAYGSTQTLGTTGGSGTGAVTYSTGASTACSVSGNTLTITSSTGTCSVTATKATDANYNAQTSAAVAITVGKAVLTVTPDAKAMTFGDPVPAYTFGVTGFAFGQNAGTAAGYVAPTCTSTYTAATPVASSPLTITCSGGSATHYTFDTTATALLSIGKANQAALVLTGTSSPAAYGSTQTLGTTGGSGTGAVTYTSTTPTVCTVSGTTLSIVSGTGTCSVYATKAADANYNAQTSATVNLTAAKINQAALVLTGTSSPAAYGSTQTLGTTGGSGTGAVTYSTGASTACSVSGNTLTITSSTGTCSVTATKATDANYNAQTSAAVAITVGKAVLTVTPDAKAMTFGDPVPAYTFGVTGFAFGQNAGTAAGYVAPTCTSTYTAATPVASSPLTITCSGGSATHYTFDTTATALLSIGKANQAALVLTGTSSPAAYGSTQTLGTTGGSGTGAVTYSTGASTACSVSGNTLTITSSTGTCSVTATKATDANYNAQTSAAVAITVGKAVLTVTPDAKAMTFGDPVPAYTFGVTGFAFGQNAGTAAGYVAPTCTSTYTAATPVASSPLTITCAGGSATHYTFDTTATALLSIGKANQAALVLTGTSSPAAYGSTQTLGTTGGSGTGAVTYTSTTPTVCTVSGTTLSIVSGTGTCSVYATKAADANYNAQTSATVNLTAAKAASTTVVTCPAGPFTYTGSAQTPCTATVTGPGGLSQSLAVSYADNTDAGTATASASYPGDANHDPSSDSTTFVIAKAASTTVVTCPAGPFTYTGSAQAPCTATVTGPGGLGQALAVSYADNTDAGTATASAAYAGDANHDPSSDSTTFTIAKADPVCSISGVTVTYDGLPHGATGLCLGVNGETLAGLDRGASFTDVPGGTADWTFTDTTGNYTDDAGSVDIEITAADPVCSISGVTVTYDGLPHGATGLCLGVNGETLAGLDRGASFTDVPGGTADWTFTDTTGNYTDDAGSVDIEIDPAVLTVTPDPQSLAFGDPVPAYPFGVTGFVTGEDETTAAGYLAPACASAYTAATPVASSPLTITCAGGSATNYTFDTSATALLTIAKAASTTVVTCPAGPFTYTGSAQAPCTATVTGPGGLGQALAVSYADNTDAGTATASAAYAGDANHDPSSDSTTFTIAKADPVCSISGVTVTYDGLPHGATGLCLGVNGETLAGLDRGASFTDVPGGTADWTFTDTTGNYTDDAGSVDIEITAADPVCSISGVTVTYDGLPHGATGLCLGVNGETLAGLDRGASFTDVPGGTADWTFTDTTGNYTDDAGSVDIEIDPAVLTVTPDPQSLAFGDPVPAYPFGVTGFVTGEDETTAAGYLAPACASAYTAATPVASSPLTITCAGGSATNYTFDTSATALLTIAKAASTTVVTCPAGPFTYTGSAQAPCTATVTGPGGLGQALAVSYADNTDAGTATASAAYAGDANHDPSSDSTTFTIAKADPVCSISGVTVTYDGLPHGATGLCLGVNGETLAGLDRGASFTDVPGGTADWTLSNPNYTAASGSVDIEIAQAAQTIEWPPLPDVTFGIPSFDLSATTGFGLPITYTSLTPTVCTVSGSTVTIVGVGVCRIVASQPGDGNVLAAQSVEQVFRVAAADDDTPETSTLTQLAGLVAGSPLQRQLLLGLSAVGALAAVIVLLGLRARRRQAESADDGR